MYLFPRVIQNCDALNDQRKVSNKSKLCIYDWRFLGWDNPNTQIANPDSTSTTDSSSMFLLQRPANQTHSSLPSNSFRKLQATLPNSTSPPRHICLLPGLAVGVLHSPPKRRTQQLVANKWHATGFKVDYEIYWKRLSKLVEFSYMFYSSSRYFEPNNKVEVHLPPKSGDRGKVPSQVQLCL